MPLPLAITLFALILITAGVWTTRLALVRSRRKARSHECFIVSIPQYDSSDEGDTDQRPENFKQRLSEVEGLYSVLASVRAQRGITAFFYGRNDHFTLEVVAQNGLISLYVAVPIGLADLFTQQLHSVYPYAHLEPVPDYNIFQPQASILSNYITLRRSFIFPIKTYLAFENDPMESLMTALSRIPSNGGAAVQFVFRSSKKSWHGAGRKVVTQVYKGTPLKEAVRGSGGKSSAFSILGKALKEVASVLGASFSTSPEQAKENPLKQPQQISPKDQEAIKGIEDKTSKAGFDANIRVVVSLPDRPTAQTHLRNILDSFSNYNIYEFGNAFKPLSVRQERTITDFIYRNFEPRARMILNAEEAVSLIHLPEHIKAPNVSWLKAKKMPPPVGLPNEGVLLGHSRFRGAETEVRIKDEDRRRHIYIIGQTGTGKSTMLDTLAVQDIERGKGVCVIDPHGDLVENIVGLIPRERAQDVIYFDPAATDRPFALNMLEFDTPDQKTFVINEMIKIFDKLYDLRQTGGPMFEQYARNAMLLIMEDPESGSTLMEIPKVLSDEKYRRYKLSKTTNPVVKDFWEKEAQKAGGDAALANMVPYITSKLNQFVSNDIMRPIIAQQKSSFNFRRVMDERKILLINLSKGRIGEMNSALLGMVIVGKLLMAALSRVDIPEKQRSDFYLYIDEFQNYTTDSIAIILSEARKYRLVLTIAHQYLGQLVKNNDSSIKDAVFGNVGTMIAYRVGVEDAEQFAEQFAPAVSEYDLMNIEKFNYYLRLLIDNQNVSAFSATSIAPRRGDQQLAQQLKELSHLTYGKARADVEREILHKTDAGNVENKTLPPIA